MTLRVSIMLTAVCALFSLAALGIIIMWLSPAHDPVVSPLLFTGAVWLVVATVSSVLGALLRLGWRRGDVEARVMARAYRQGALLATVTIAALWLARTRLLTTLTAIALVALGACVELFFLSSRRGPRPQTSDGTDP